jgi:hypothetical protein
MALTLLAGTVPDGQVSLPVGQTIEAPAIVKPATLPAK